MCGVCFRQFTHKSDLEYYRDNIKCALEKKRKGKENKPVEIAKKKKVIEMVNLDESSTAPKQNYPIFNPPRETPDPIIICQPADSALELEADLEPKEPPPFKLDGGFLDEEYEESYKEDPVSFEQIPAEEKEFVNEDIRHLYELPKHWRSIKTKNFIDKGGVMHQYNLRLNQFTRKTCVNFVCHVFSLQDHTFRVQIAYGFILESNPPNENYRRLRVF